MSRGRRRTPIITVSGWVVSAILFVYILQHTRYSDNHKSRRFDKEYSDILQHASSLNNAIESPAAHAVPETPPPPPRIVPLQPITSGRKHDDGLFGPWSSFEKLFFFGDSYTSTNFDVWGPGPSPENPLGNHYGVEGEMEKPSWPVFLTKTHNASVLLSYDLAVGGSTVDRTIAKPYILGSDFRAETDLFMDHYGPNATYPKATWHADKTLFFVWFGINDLILEWYNEWPKELQMVPEFLSYRNTTDRLYAAGARKFIFQTVPPAYRSVDFSPDILLIIAEDMALFNSRIFELRAALAAAYPDATFAVFDTHSFWARVIENPKEFEETKDVVISTAVCEEPDPEKDKEGQEVVIVSPDGAHVVQKSKVDYDIESNLQVRDEKKKKPAKSPWEECYDGLPLLSHLWTQMHGTAVIHNATAAKIVKDCLGPQGKKGYCF